MKQRLLAPASRGLGLGGVRSWASEVEEADGGRAADGVGLGEGAGVRVDSEGHDGVRVLVRDEEEVGVRPGEVDVPGRDAARGEVDRVLLGRAGERVEVEAGEEALDADGAVRAVKSFWKVLNEF